MAKPALRHLIEDYHLLSYDLLDSTNEEAKRLAAGGGAHGAVIWAKRQTAGRGRMGREWVSAEGNLFVSVLLEAPQDINRTSQLSFVAAVAAAETLDGIVGEEGGNITCKWPNDILYKGKKISGILLEAFSTTTEFGQTRQWVVVGVGINVDSYPEHVIYPACCLREAGVEIISAKIVLSRFIHSFVQSYDLWASKGFAAIHKAWMQRAYQLGKPISVLVGEQETQGIFDGIDPSGRLLIRHESGAITGLTAGEVFFKELQD